MHQHGLRQKLWTLRIYLNNNKEWICTSWELEKSLLLLSLSRSPNIILSEVYSAARGVRYIDIKDIFCKISILIRIFISNNPIPIPLASGSWGTWLGERDDWGWVKTNDKWQSEEDDIQWTRNLVQIVQHIARTHYALSSSSSL